MTANQHFDLIPSGIEWIGVLIQIAKTIVLGIVVVCLLGLLFLPLKLVGMLHENLNQTAQVEGAQRDILDDLVVWAFWHRKG